MKPHTAECLRTWVSLSHQANNMLLLLVLQFGSLPRVVIKEKKKIPEMKQEKPGDAASGILLLPCPGRGARGTEEHLPWDPADCLLLFSSELLLR